VSVTDTSNPVGNGVIKTLNVIAGPSWIAVIPTALSTVSAASFSSGPLAGEAIRDIFGLELAPIVRAANTVPLPTTLAGAAVKVRDSSGLERLAPLFFVSSGQINYLVPAGTGVGMATITATNHSGFVSTTTKQMALVAPGLFTANASGQGVAAAVLRVKADGSLSYKPVSRFDSSQNRFIPAPIDLGTATDQVFLLLFGTGIRNRCALADVTAVIGGATVETLYAGPQGDFAGPDQLNLRLPRSLIGRGLTDVALTIAGQTANSVQVSFR
jgi:uncharacterized protein (TIGR03437 family)